MNLVKEKGVEEAEAREDRSPRVTEEVAAGGEEEEDGGEDEPENRLRKVRKTSFGEKEEYLRYYILASETALCSEDA
jgi:hypothetical protein